MARHRLEMQLPDRGRRRAERRWFGRGRTRALLSLGTVLALAVTGTAAYWTDTATVTGGTITSGSMDLQVSNNGSSWGAIGSGVGHSATHLTVTGMTPSESYAFPLHVRNVGDADFTYTVTVTQGTTPTWGFVGQPITVQVYRGGTPSTDTTYPIQQECSGGTSLGAAQTVTAGASSVVPSPERLNAGDAAQTLCVKVSMLSSATNSNQGKSGQLRFDITATQVTS